MIPVLDGILSVAGKILDKFPNGDEKLKLAAELQQKQAEAEMQMAQMLADIDKKQLDIDNTEAASQDKFVSRWRPALGWVCVVAIALYYWPRFLLGMFFWCRLSWHAQTLIPLPEMGISDVVGLITPLLGFGTMRMMEKKWGVASK